MCVCMYVCMCVVMLGTSVLIIPSIHPMHPFVGDPRCRFLSIDLFLCSNISEWKGGEGLWFDRFD